MLFVYQKESELMFPILKNINCLHFKLNWVWKTNIKIGSK